MKASGNGMIVRNDHRLFAVQGDAEGRVQRVLVAAGQTVRSGDILVEVRQDRLDTEIAEAKTEVAQRTAELEALQTRTKTATAAQDASLAQLETIYTRSITELENSRDALEASLLNNSGAGLEGSPPPSSESLSYHPFLQNTLIQLTRLQTELATAKQQGADLKAAAATRIDIARDALLASQDALNRLTATRDQNGVIRAPSAGRIEEIRVIQGQTITPETIAMIISSGGDGYEMIAFLQPADAKRVTSGMAAHVGPVTASKAEYGTIQGTVTSVSPDPVSPAFVNTLFQDLSLSEQLSSGGLAYLARISLRSDTTAPSGFRWWTGDGPSFPIEPGTLADVEIVLEDLPPVTLVIPAAQDLFRS
ncbi:MAG: HlyD family efflux transporter periplasmic adaptor subunit [Pseudomonadota bacterium]